MTELKTLNLEQMTELRLQLWQEALALHKIELVHDALDRESPTYQISLNASPQNIQTKIEVLLTTPLLSN